MNINFQKIASYFKSFKKSDYIAIIISLIFFLIFSIYSIEQYLSISDSAYDLGINANVLYNFIHGHLFYSNALGFDLLSQHFDPFEFLLVPVYFIYPSPISLLLFENFFVALAGLILYKIVKVFFKDKITSGFFLSVLAIGFLLIYEMSPYSQSLISFPFHRLAFLPFFFFLAFYSFFNNKQILHYFSLIMIISLHSNFIFIVAVILLYELIYIRTSKGKTISVWLSRTKDVNNNRNILYFIIFIGLLYSYDIFASFIKGTFNGIYTFSLLPTTGAIGTVSSSPGGVVSTLFTNPYLFYKVITVDYGMKEFYLALSLANTIFLPLLSPLSLIMTLPYILYAIPSSYGAYSELGLQYTAMLIAPLFISAIIGFYNLLRIAEYLKKKKVFIRFKNNNDMDKKYGAILVTVLVITLIVMLPFGILAPVGFENSSHDSQIADINGFNNNGGGSFLIKFSKSIPADSYILTENNLMPYFSDHYNVYETAFNSLYLNNLSKFQYIVVQNNSYWAKCGGNTSLDNIAHDGITDGNYHIMMEYQKDSIYILEKNN